MESRAKYILIGNSILVFMVLFITTIFWLTGAMGSSETNYYLVYFKRHTLDGLQKDSAVTMKGIKVGSVDNYTISPESVEEVKVVLRLVKGTPVKENTKAIINRNLLTGLANIALTGGSEDSPLRSKPPKGEKFPIIPEGRSQIDAIAGSVPGMLEQASEAFTRANSILSDENIKVFGNTLKNFEKMSNQLEASSKELDTTLVGIVDTAKNMSKTSEALREFATNSNSSLDTFTSEAQATLEELRSTIEVLKREIETVSGGMRAATQVFTQEITSVSQEVSNAAKSVSKTVEGFENPRSIISGPAPEELGPGE